MAKALNVSLAVTADTGQAKAALQQLQQALTQLTTTASNISIGGQLKQDAVEATKQIAQLQSMLKSSTNQVTGNLDLTKFNQQLQLSGTSLSTYQKALSSMGTSGSQAFAQLAQSISQAEVPLRRSNAMLKEFGTVLQNTVRWQISSSLIHGFMGTIQHAVGYAQDLNESLNKIQIVTQASDQHMANFAKSANEAAKRLSTTTTTYTDASLIYYQQGLSDKEVAERTEVTIKMANAAGVSAQKVSDQMTAVWNNFDNGSKSLEYYADVMTALGAATASSTDEISTGLSKFASVADAVGLSYENAAAALATITATTRNSADSVGTGLRTLFSRLQSVKLGETLEDGVDLTKYSKAIATMGVNILDANGQLKSMDNILDEMGAKWQGLNNTQKVAIAQTVGGVRQYTNLIALLDNYDFYKQNQQIALNSEGTVQKQADIYAKSWEAAQKRVKASAESIYSDLLNDKFFIGVNNGFSGFLNLIHNTINALGGLKGIMLALAGIATTVFSKQVATGLQNAIYDLKMLTPGGRQQVQNLRQQGNDLLIQAYNAQGTDFGQTMANAYSQQSTLSQAYLANANQMNQVQQQIAQSLMQQQSALIKNVELSAQEVVNQTEKSKIAERETRRNYNQANKNQGMAMTPKDVAQETERLRKMATQVGKIDALFGGQDHRLFNLTDVQGLAQIDQLLKNLGVTMQSFEGYSDTAKQAAQNFFDALKNQDVAAAQQALQDLEAEIMDIGATGFESELDTLAEKLEKMGPPGEKAAKALREMTTAGQAAGGAAVQEAQNIQVLQSQTEKAAQAMTDLAAKNYSAMDSFTAVMGFVTSFAMALNSVHSIMETIGDDSLSFGEKLSSIALSLTPIVMMISNTKWEVLASLGSKLGTAFAPLGSLQTWLTGALGSITGLSTAAGGLLSILGSLLPIIGAIGLAIMGIMRYDATHETQAEQLTRVTEEAESAETAAVEAKRAYDDLLASKSQHDTLLDKLNELTKGTQEFRDALIQANDVAMGMIKSGGLQYGKDWKYNDNGAIEFIEEGFNNTIEQKRLQVEATGRASLAASAIKSAVEIRNDRKNNLDTINSLMENDFAVNDQLRNYLDSISGTTGFQANTAADLFEYGFLSNFENFKTWAGPNSTWADFVNSGQLNGIYSQLLSPEIVNNVFAAAFGESFDNLYSKTRPETLAKIAAANNDLSILTSSFITDSNDLIQEYIAQSLLETYGDGTYIADLEQKLEKQHKDYSDDELKARYSELANGAVADKNWDRTTLEDEVKALEVAKDLGEKYSTRVEEATKVWGNSFKDIDKKTLKQINDSKKEVLERAKGPQDETTRQLGAALYESMVKQGERALQSYIETGALYHGDMSGFQFDTATGKLSSGVDVSSLTLGQMSQIETAAKQFGGTFGNESAKYVFDAMTKQILENGESPLQGIINQIDWHASTIGIISNFKDAIERADLGETYKDLMETMIQESGGMTGLLEDLIYSEDFKKSLKSIQKQVAKTGKVGASEIESIAEQVEDLDSWLDEAGISAETLGDILTDLTLGDLDLSEFNDELMQAYDIANELDNTLGEAFAFVDNFSPDRSVMDIASTIGSWFKQFKTSTEAGYIGDPAALSIVKKMFSPEAYTAYMKWGEYATGADLDPEAFAESFRTTNKRMLTAMTKVMEEGNLSGLYEYAIDTIKQNGGQVEVNGKNYNIDDIIKYNPKTGEVTTQNDEQFKQLFKNESDFTDFIEKYGGLGEGVSPTMVADYVAQNTWLRRYWGESAAKDSVDYLQSKMKEGKMFSYDAIKQFGERYGEFLAPDGKTYADWTEQFVKDNRRNIIDLHDLNMEMANYQDLKKAMSEGKGIHLDEYIDTLRDKERNLDLDSLLQGYQDLGATAAQAIQMVNAQVAESGEVLTTYIKDSKGIRHQIDTNDPLYQEWAATNEYVQNSVEGLQAYADYMNKAASDTAAAEAAADSWSKAVTEGFKAAFQDISFDIEFPNGTTAKITSQVKEAIEKGGEEAELEIDAISSAQPGEIPENQQYLKDQAEALNQFQQACNEQKESLQQLQDETLSQVSEAIADLESAKAEAVTDIMSAVEDAENLIADAKESLNAALEAAETGQAEAAQTYLAQAEAQVNAAKEAAENAKTAAEEAKKVQQQMADEAKARAEAAEQAANEKVEAMQAIVDGLQQENDALLASAQSALEEAGAAQQAAIEAAADAAAAAQEANIAAAEDAAARAEEAAARAEAAVQAVMDSMATQSRQSQLETGPIDENGNINLQPTQPAGYTGNKVQQAITEFADAALSLPGKALHAVGEFFMPTSYAEELSEAEQKTQQFGNTADDVFANVNERGIHPNVDTTSIEDSIDALERLGEARQKLGEEAEANPVQLHASADVNDPSKKKDIYGSYGLNPDGTPMSGAEDTSHPEGILGGLAEDVKKIGTNVQTSTDLQKEDSRNVVNAYEDSGKRDYKGAPASNAELDLVDQMQKGGFGTSKEEIKALESLATASENLVDLPDSLIDAVKTVQTEHGGEIDAERVQEVQASVNATANVDVEAEVTNTEEIAEQIEEAAGDAEVEVDIQTNEEELVVEDQTAEVDLTVGEQEEAEDDDALVNYKWGSQDPPVDLGAAVNYYKGYQQPPDDMEATVNYKKGTQEGPDDSPGASGSNNGNGRFAAGKHFGNKYWGLATVGELGPELFIHRGMPYLAGVNGRTRAYIEPNDEIYTAAETQRILENNPSLQDLPGFSTGYHKISWGNDTSGGGGGYGSGAKSSNKKSAKFDPERYHLISRQIDDITRRYERLDKIKDKAFGKNKIKAIQDEIDVTNDLIQAQEQLIHEANAYMNQDLATLRAYGVNVQLDKHGNLQNFEQLQEQYGRPATEAEDQEVKEYYSTIWKAIQQYEESVDKLNEAYEKYDDLIYQLADLSLEQFTARVEMKIDYDDKSIKLLDHYLGRINNDIYKTAEAFELTETKLDTNLHKLDSYYDGISKIMMTLHDQDGNLIQGMSLDKFLGLTDAQRDALKVSSDDMEAIAGYLEDMIDVIEEMDDEKLDWAEKLSTAFDELNGKVENSLNLFTHYQTLLESISNISDLMGTGITKQSRKLLKDLNTGLLNNTKNSLTAAKDYLDTLEQAAAQTKWLLKNETDTDLKKQYQEELDEIEGMIRDTQENILSYWETALQMAQDMFDQAMEQSLQDYERSFAGMYVSLDRWGEAYDRRKEIQQQYVEDYEKYYQLSKLDRDINKSIDELANKSSKHHKGLSDLLAEVQQYQKNGQKLSEYDIEVLQKKYELEKARAELEEAREAKTTVRLQRNRDGSWGYVYTADEDKLDELQANLEEAIYNYQKLNDEQIHRLQDELVDFQQTMGEAVNDIMSDTTLTYKEKLYQIQELQKDYLSQQNFLFSELSKAMGTQGSTYGKAIDIYKGKTDELGNAFVDLEDTFKETVLSQLLGIKDLGAYKDEMVSNWEELIKVSQEALLEYQENVDDINKTAGSSTKNFYNDATKWIEAIGTTSGQTTKEVQSLGDELSTQFKRLAEEAKNFSAMWKEKMKEVTTSTEPFVQQMTAILGLMNDAYDAFNIADGTATQVYKDIVTGTHTNHNLTGPDTSAVNTGIVNPYADIEAQYLALQQQLEDQYAAYQNEILNYYNEVQGNIMGALGDLTNNWNSILNTQSSLMGYGLNTGLNYGGLGNLAGGWNQSVNIAADFPSVTSSFEIEEAFNNLVNKATQYANIPW